MTEQEYERQFQMIFQAMKAGFITKERAQELVKELHDEFINDENSEVKE